MTLITYECAKCLAHWRAWHQAGEDPPPCRCGCATVTALSERELSYVIGRGDDTYVTVQGDDGAEVVVFQLDVTKATTWPSYRQALQEVLDRDELHVATDRVLERGPCSVGQVIDRTLAHGYVGESGEIAIRWDSLVGGLPAPGGRIYLPCGECGVIAMVPPNTVATLCPSCFVGPAAASRVPSYDARLA